MLEKHKIEEYQKTKEEEKKKYTDDQILKASNLIYKDCLFLPGFHSIAFDYKKQCLVVYTKKPNAVKKLPKEVDRILVEVRKIEQKKR